VLAEFDRLTDRGGVLGAMERQYQRGAIQDDSMKYERMKHSGELPIVGVNTFLPKAKSEASIPRDVALSRASDEEKKACIARLRAFHAEHAAHAPAVLQRLEAACLTRPSGDRGNGFEALLDAVEHCSLGQITGRLQEIVGRFRPTM